MNSSITENSFATRADKLINQGDRFFKNSDYPAALQSYRQALDLHPESSFSILARAALLARIRQPQPAALYCEKHLELFPQDPEGWKLKSQLAIAEGRSQESLMAIERARQLAPDDVEMLLFQGYLLADIFQEYQKALTFYDAALQLQPRNPTIWRKKGRALHNLDQFKKAISCYNKSLRLERGNPETWKDKGDCLNCLALSRKALACYKKAIRLQPDRADFYHIAALTYDELGEREKSQFCYRKVIEHGTPEDLEMVNEARIALDAPEKK